MTASTDPSTRYVLPPDAPYLANLAALWHHQPDLARKIEALDTQDAGYVVEPSKSGPPTLTVKTADNRSISLHSRYNPLAEAQKLLEPTPVDGCIVFHVQGLGLGYHLEALAERASSESLIFVFEPDLQLLRITLEHRDLSKLIESGRVHFFTELNKAEIFTKLTPHCAMCSMGFEGVVHPPSVALNPQFFAEIQTWIAEFAAFARTSLNTLVINGRRTAENITRNLATYVQTSSVNELRDRYKGQPAIIVSAGPSLRKNKHLLKDAQGKAVFIAVQTILQPLLEMGIEPQFVTSLDYHDISTRYYEKLPKNLATHLVAEPKASPKIFDVFPGPVTVLGSDYADRLLREFAKEMDKGRLSSGATVAHLAFYLAEHLGCDPVIFVGQDLGFGDGLAYAPGTNIDDVWRPELSRFCTIEMKQWEFIARDRHILRKIPDVEGRPMYTEERLFTYLQQFERDFLRTKRRVIDATEGGAKKRGADTRKLADAIREFCREPLNPSAAAQGDGRPGQQWLRAGKCVASLQARREEARQIELISHDTLPLLEEIRDHLDDQPRVNRAIALIDALRARIDTFGATYDLVTQLTQKTELERFQRDRRMQSKKLTGLELQRNQITRDVENVRAVAAAAREFQNLMDEMIQKLKTFTDPVPSKETTPAAAPVAPLAA
ncbi:MAG TPA: 6-hydroxymethylpterin diphosphokinase MptE-like protein [Tepidisphaeraceae bacterium]